MRGLLPLEIAVKNGAASRVWKLGLAPVESFIGVLSLISLQSAMDTMFEGNSPGSVIVRTSLEFTDRPNISLRDRATDENDVGSSAALRAAVPIAVLLENPYRASGLKIMEKLIQKGHALAYLPDYYVKELDLVYLNVTGCPYSCQQSVKLICKDPDALGWMSKIWDGL